MPRSMISQGEYSILLVRVFISRSDRSGWLNNLDLLAGVRPQSKVECSTGVRPQSKVAGDCTLAPDPRGAPDPGGGRDLGKTLYRFMGFPLVGVE